MEAINEDLFNDIQTWLYVFGFLDVEQELGTNQEGGPHSHRVAVRKIVNGYTHHHTHARAILNLPSQ
jgi:hypothetical protein